MILLEEVPRQAKPVMRQLLEFYEYELSAFSGRQLTEHGFFDYPYLDHYWVEAGRYPYFILCEDRVAGFALVREVAQSPVPYCTVAEFFVMRRYQGQQVGRSAAEQVFARHPGQWLIQQEANNHAAQRFWQRVIGRLTHGQYQQSVLPDGTYQQEFLIEPVKLAGR